MSVFAEIHSKAGMPDALQSKDGRLKLQLLTWIEPNNGRMLWQTDVLFDGENWNDRIFQNGWNCVYEALDKLDLEDDAHTHYFIPAEGHLQVIRARDKAVIELPASPEQGFYFIGNMFVGRKLVLFFLGKWAVYSLDDYSLIQHEICSQEYVFDMRAENETTISVGYYTVSEGVRTEVYRSHTI